MTIWPRAPIAELAGDIEVFARFRAEAREEGRIAGRREMKEQAAKIIGEDGK